MSHPIKRAILRRRSVSATSIVGLGPFDENGEREVTHWTSKMEIEPKPGDGVVVYARLGGVRSVVLRTCRLERSDDDLRLLALEDFASKCGALLEVEHEAPAPPAPPAPAPKRAKKTEE